MINARIDKQKVEITALGDMATLLAEISSLIMHISKGLGDESAQEAFKTCFATGYVNGEVYEISREEMDKIIIEAYQLADEVNDMRKRGKHEAQ